MSTAMLDRVRADIRAKLDARAAAQTELDALIDTIATENRADLTPEETTKVGELRATLADADQAIDEYRTREGELVEDESRRQAADQIRSALPATTSDAPAHAAQAAGSSVAVRSEPTTYHRGGQFSYFKDLVDVSRPDGSLDQRSRERLNRHRDEVEVELRGDPELRANMNRTDGTGGEFVPPLWLMNEYLKLARAGRITADLCRKLPLPPGTDSINLPAVSTGTATAEQSDGASVTKTDMTTTSKSAAVTTIAGQQVFAIQLLDQSPINFDEVVFQDLLADLATRVDVYVLNKASIGILNVSGIISVSYTDASPTVPELYPKIADATQQIHTNRFLPPQAHVMHPRRWAWHLAALDSSSRPLVVPNAQGPMNAFAGMTDVRSEGAVGSLQGLPVYVDPNVPINLGAGTNEDRIITARFDDLYLYEGAVRTRVLFETDADTLSVRLQVWEYLAFLGSRYPKAIAVTSGTGLITPTF